MGRSYYAVSAVVVLTAALGGCARSDRTAKNEVDHRPMATDNTRSRTAMTETPMSHSAEDVALASSVKRRLSEDMTINTREMNVSADQGKIYLSGTADTREEKIRAEQHALEVAGVSSVDNRLQVQSAGMSHDARTARTGNSGACTLAAVIPATRTESSFGTVEMRVFDDVTSPLYRKSKDKTHDKTYEGRERDIHGDRAYDERRRESEIRPDVSEVTPRVSVLPGETTPSGAGPTGGTMQAEAAQQGGTFEQTGRSHDLGDRRSEAYDDREKARLHEERITERTIGEPRMYGDDARLSNRRNLIWSGWLKNGERRDISSERGPIRYDYRYSADDRFHDSKGAWCNEGHRVIVP